MKLATVALLSLAGVARAAPKPKPKPDVDTSYPYTGPKVPIGDWVDQTVNGNGKGYPRLHEPPAVKPAKSNPTNNINVVSHSYIPDGMHIHYQTPFGLGTAPEVHWGKSPSVKNVAKGFTHTYDRTPPCSAFDAVTQCSQFFHEVSLHHLEPDTTYYYSIAAANGTTASPVRSFKTARAPGDRTPFTVAVLNDMGYTNAQGTHKKLQEAVSEGKAAFAWHGGDLSYADDWYDGILPCEDSWPTCYNGTSSRLPPGDYPPEYNTPVPAGEVPSQGGPNGGDMSSLYESNWDLWQQWMQNITNQIPYMVMLGNHEASCAEFDGSGNVLATYLNKDKANSSSDAKLNYFSCPPSQRNFTAFQHRFWMAGEETGGVGNFWYSFDYGLAHFITLDGETDFTDSPMYNFLEDTHGHGSHPSPDETSSTDSGPFGYIKEGKYWDNTAYQQYQWLRADLERVDRSKTPWVIAMSHRPMYSTNHARYQEHIAKAWEGLMLEHGVNVYLAGHVHWYERTYPLLHGGDVDHSAVLDNRHFLTNEGKSMLHLINGMAGNIESHTTLRPGEKIRPLTAALDDHHYGFSTMSINETTFHWQFIRGDGEGVQDEVVLQKAKCSV